MTLQGRIAIVTGAGAGIGAAIAARLASEGAKVLIADRDEQAALQAAAQIGAQIGKLDYVRCLVADVARPEDAERIAATAEELFGGLDILVNNAGIGIGVPFLDTSLEQWSKVLAVNLTGPLLCGQAAARRMVRKGYGRIVNMTSISGFVASSARTAYGSSKAGLIGLTKQMALELGPLGITVNAIAPGPVDTPLTQAMHTPDSRAAFTAKVPLGRYGTVDEIAAAAAFLASDEAAYVNGAILPVDGGFLATGMIAPDAMRGMSGRD